MPLADHSPFVRSFFLPVLLLGNVFRRKRFPSRTLSGLTGCSNTESPYLRDSSFFLSHTSKRLGALLKLGCPLPEGLMRMHRSLDHTGVSMPISWFTLWKRKRDIPSVGKEARHFALSTPSAWSHEVEIKVGVSSMASSADADGCFGRLAGHKSFNFSRKKKRSRLALLSIWWETIGRVLARDCTPVMA